MLTILTESDVLSTLPRPTVDFVIPETVPENAGLANGAFKSRAVWVGLLTILAESGQPWTSKFQKPFLKKRGLPTELLNREQFESDCL